MSKEDLPGQLDLFDCGFEFKGRDYFHNFFIKRFKDEQKEQTVDNDDSFRVQD